MQAGTVSDQRWPDIDVAGPTEAARHTRSRRHRHRGLDLDADALADLYAAAAEHTSCVAEQTLLVVWCVSAGRDGRYLRRRAATRRERGRLPDRHPEGDTWVKGPPPLGLFDRGPT